MEDSDKILRVENKCVCNKIIIKLLSQHGYHAEVLI